MNAILLEMVHSKNYRKKRAKCKKIHGHIKDTVKFEIRRVIMTSLLNFKKINSDQERKNSL